MKSPPASDECDDIFGPPRQYPSSYYPTRNRPSMISAKYRQKEERRKVLKISVNKLKKIEDPEASLCRSVLINNTMKRLQKEARDEKLQKQQLNYPRCFEIKNEIDFGAEKDFDVKLAEEMVSVKSMEVLSDLVGESIVEPSRKRPLEDVEDCDVQDVLKQLYMPPTPRMLTCIDEDEEEHQQQQQQQQQQAAKRTKVDSDFSVNYNNNVRVNEPAEASFSCGHASMFSELQSTVYHNLIASLET